MVNPHNNYEDFKSKEIVFENTLNQIVSCQVQSSRESTFAVPHNVGSPISVAATSGAEYATLTDYVLYLRVVATCAVQPASGSLNVYVEKLGV